ETRLLLPAFQQRRHGAPRIAGMAAVDEKGDDIDRPRQAGRAQGEIAHVARPDTDAVERAAACGAGEFVEAGHSASLANAWTPAAIAMSRATSVMPQAWMMRTATRSSAGEKRARSDSARMMAKERR